MYQFRVIEQRSGRREIAVSFPYRLLYQFKNAVRRDDRRWAAPYWLITAAGFRSLADAYGDQFQPLPYDVLELAYPDRSTAPAKLRMARRVDARGFDA